VSGQDVEERRHDFERTLMEADRMMMQTVQTALSLIGFGFTINTFFNEVDPSRTATAGEAARALGVALLMIGLLLLVTGTWTQARFRRELKQRYGGAELKEAGQGLRSRFTPSFVSAVLLMLVGVVALAWVLLTPLF
jgi:putative membrane protein